MSGLVLITGATGFIGFHVLLRVLDAGYSVRAAVRSPKKVDLLLAVPDLRTRNPGARLSFVTVPDLTVPGAYDEAVAGADYVIHLASPLPNFDLTPDRWEAELVTPAVQGTLGILASAQKEPAVKRVVITSSIAAILPPDVLTRGSDDKVFTAESRTPNVADVSTLHDAFQAYAASKARALNETDAWVRQHRPAFGVVNVHPSFVMGRELIGRTPAAIRGTADAFILSVVLGGEGESASPAPGSTVHVDDVVRVHVDALKSSVPANTGYVVNWNPEGTLDGTVWDDAAKFVAKHFPDAVARGVLPNKGRLPSVALKFDVRKTEETFGFRHLSYEQQVKDVVGQYLELVESK
ncbi:hypothetical protein GGR54DRAFT_578364 [Hypoxylon sp. NC1633]|nr:hypothetical protein GGR54DRAFT_578364 [Hypoxylon sp. NC1633]